MNSQKVIKSTEAAKIFDVSTQAIRSWIKDGTFQGAYKKNPLKKTSVWMIPVSEIDRLLALRQGDSEANPHP